MTMNLPTPNTRIDLIKNQIQVRTDVMCGRIYTMNRLKNALVAVVIGFCFPLALADASVKKISARSLEDVIHEKFEGLDCEIDLSEKPSFETNLYVTGAVYVQYHCASMPGIESFVQGFLIDKGSKKAFTIDKLIKPGFYHDPPSGIDQHSNAAEVCGKLVNLGFFINRNKILLNGFEGNHRNRFQLVEDAQMRDDDILEPEKILQHHFSCVTEVSIGDLAPYLSETGYGILSEGFLGLTKPKKNQTQPD